METQQPQNTDAVLGDENSLLPGSAILGGVGCLEPYPYETVRLTIAPWGEVEIERQTRLGTQFMEPLGKMMPLELVQIPGGTFVMGAPESEEWSDRDERPQHEVNVPSFFMAKYPVTQSQYRAVMGKSPSYYRENGDRENGANRPVDSVTWHDAQAFCRKLTELKRLELPTRIYRLPSEAEWEYACRAGTTTPFAFGKTITVDLANYNNGRHPDSNAPYAARRKQTTTVGTFPPNAFGLYDMHGNVWEWCATPTTDHHGQSQQLGRVQRAPTDGDITDRHGQHAENIVRADCIRPLDATPTTDHHGQSQQSGRVQRAPTGNGGQHAPTVGDIVRGYKSAVTKRINELRNTPGLPVWQRNYHEHIIRNEIAYLKIADYTQTNPQRWQEDTYHV